MKKDIKISIIVTAYNHEKYIGRCLRSLLKQSINTNLYEINLVNDASNDRTQFGCELFCDPVDSIIKIIQNSSNLGLPASLNKAIRSSNGEFIVRVDADDWVSKDFTKLLYTFLENNDYMDAIACDYFTVNNNGIILERKNCFDDPIACGIMFRKKHLLEIGLYDENFQINEERDLRIRFEKKYKIHRLELPLYRYRKHDKNMTNNKYALKEYNQKLIDKHRQK
tara:strand:- start:4325 stop:4996 length:672 start_codon:yes stop_codon:yes gene_type:complete